MPLSYKEERRNHKTARTLPAPNKAVGKKRKKKSKSVVVEWRSYGGRISSWGLGKWSKYKSYSSLEVAEEAVARLSRKCVEVNDKPLFEFRVGGG